MAAHRSRSRRCLHCKGLYKPDPRNRRRQRYCCAPACRKASKKASQARWLSKPANRNYFRGPENTARNRRWREAHPGYRKGQKRRRTQQDLCSPQGTDDQQVAPSLAILAQKDLFSPQLTVFVGLIANLVDSSQQETIDGSLRRLHDLGSKILAQPASGQTLLATLVPATTRDPPPPPT
jgi:hypothetical protein